MRGGARLHTVVAAIEEATMSLRKRWFACAYDRMSAKAEKAGLGALREELLADASGDVLEIGGGTGANLAYYGTAVETLTLTEPDPSMLRRLERRAREHGPFAEG